jgi:hypothetical protein
MTDSLGPWGSWRVRNNPDATGADLDRLRIAGKHCEELVATQGWQVLQNWLAVQQVAKVNFLTAEPTSELAETYAVKRAYAAGFLKGLKHAFDTPQALIKIAEQELEWAQRASEELARRQGDQS